MSRNIRYYAVFFKVIAYYLLCYHTVYSQFIFSRNVNHIKENSSYPSYVLREGLSLFSAHDLSSNALSLRFLQFHGPIDGFHFIHLYEIRVFSITYVPHVTPTPSIRFNPVFEQNSYYTCTYRGAKITR